MRQFLEQKAHHPDAILFFRVGDFYEMFFEDAVEAASLLDLTLTTRDKGKDDAVPMCGIPHHATRTYVARLTELGKTVAICDQVEDPKLAKGLVKREVVRIITPGVVLDDELLDPKTGRYVAAVVPAPGKDSRFGLAYLDASTGEFRATEVEDLDALLGELVRVAPSEILVGPAELEGALAALAQRYQGATYNTIERNSAGAATELLVSALAGTSEELGLTALTLGARAAADVLAYARATQPAGALPVTRLQVYQPGEAVVLDEAAVANLELVQTLMGGKRAGSLLSVIDRTSTAPGGRLLRRWVLYPLTEIAPIRRRQDAIGYFVEHAATRGEVRAALDGVSDLERLAGRVSLGVATPRDLGKLRDSLAQVPELVAAIESDLGARPATGLPELVCLPPRMLEALAKIHDELDTALVADPPPLAKDGGFIRDGYCDVVDTNRQLADGGRSEILAIEARERERTGIPNLKVKYNRVFGYYLEVSKSHLARVPDHYVRKQTIANAERYVTGELAELESKILQASETLVAREQQLLAELCRRIAEHTALLGRAGHAIATVDCCAALAELAHHGAYTRPVVDDGDLIDIRDGRHPVVERSVGAGSFVPNDCTVDPGDAQILLITGPNMAGKSTYMRQVAHIVLLAQMGSFVPAASAHIGVVDRIFTRVGAADNLARGESTFMVEMRETAAILAGATRRSLVVLDEVGRGTSTFDGVSIAWAVTEYLHDAIGCRTLFATHYHELCALAETRPRIRNFSVAVRERGGEIVFLRQVIPGGANRSYGIDVARLAGLPASVVSRARQMLAELEGGRALAETKQLALFSAAQAAPRIPDDARSQLAAALAEIDVDRTTPVEALLALQRLRGMLDS